jgi:chemotaxis signal transduction protein
VEQIPFRPGQYLTFRLARREFAVDASRVRAILPFHELAPIGPRAGGRTGWLAGFASLEGGLHFPVIDLAAKLRLPAAARARQPSIVVLETATPDGLRLAGFVADGVSDVVTARERDFRSGKLRMGGRPRRVLDPDSIL